MAQLDPRIFPAHICKVTKGAKQLPSVAVCRRFIENMTPHSPQTLWLVPRAESGLSESLILRLPLIKRTHRCGAGCAAARLHARIGPLKARSVSLAAAPEHFAEVR